MVVAATHVVARSQGCRNRRTGRTSRARPAIKSSVFITLGSVQRPAERNHGPVSRNLQRADAQAARRRSLLEGQLLQLQQFDRLSLPPRQRSDRLLQHLPVLKALVVGIRWPVRKGYGGIVDVDLARGLPGITPRTVSETVTDNGEQPRREWTVRVICCADCVERQQDVLDKVLDVGPAGESPTTIDDLTDSRRDVLQELQVGVRVASLGGAHEVRKLVICRHGVSLPQGSRVTF